MADKLQSQKKIFFSIFRMERPAPLNENINLDLREIY